MRQPLTEIPNPVAEAAARLDTSEARVIDLAYRWWFGVAPPEQVLKRIQDAYLMADTTPPWARHFARQVLALPSRDRRAATALGLDRLGSAPAPRHGKLIVGATGLATLVLLLLVLRAPAHLDPAAGERPSCYGGGPGLAFFEQLAYGLSDRIPPDC